MDEKAELVSRLALFNEELKKQNTIRRTKVIGMEIHKITVRLAEIRRYAKSRSYSFFEAYYQICVKSLPLNVKIDIEKSAEEALKNGVQQNNLPKINLESLETIQIRNEHKNLLNEVKKHAANKAKTTNAIRNAFRIFNNTLSPDEYKKCEEAFNLLRSIIN